MDKQREWTINDAQRVGYSYVPIQNSVLTNIYSPEMGLERGTIFPFLDIPLGVYGFQFLQQFLLFVMQVLI